MNKFLFKVFFVLMMLSAFFTMRAYGLDVYSSQIVIFGYINTLLIIISITYILLNINRIRSNTTIVILTIWIVYALMVSVLYLPNFYFAYFREIVIAGLTFYVGYFLSKTSPQAIKNFRQIALITLPFLIFEFVSISQFRTKIIGKEGISALVNYVYFIISLLPLLILSTKKNFNTFIIIIVLICSLISMKRAALITMILCMLLYMYLVILRGKRFFKKIVLILILIIGVYAVFQNFSDSYLFSRFENILEDKGSNRLDIYERVFNVIAFLPISEIIIGHGYNSVLINDITGMDVSAHNDLLEILYDYGIIGIILSIGFIVQIIRTTIRIRLIPELNYVFISMVMSLTIFFVVSTFSHMVISPMYFMQIMFIWGFASGIVTSTLRRNIL